jgi:polyisoprenoid-binding protein YceI
MALKQFNRPDRKAGDFCGQQQPIMSTATQASAGTAVKWTIDPVHSSIEFKVKHLMFTTVTGSFRTYSAEIAAGGDDLSHAQVNFSAEAASVYTGNDQRDAHLKSPEFFDVVKYPAITFRSVRADAVDGDGSWVLHGDLTINGITKPISLDVEWGGVVKDPWGNVKAGVKINGKLERSKWNLVWNAALESGGVLVSDEVRIACEVQLVKQG